MGFFDRLLGTRPGSSTDQAADGGSARTTADDAGAPASELTDAEREQTTARIAEIDAELASAPAPSTSSSPSSPSASDPADLHEELGTLHERLGDTGAAIASFEASLEARPRYGASYNRLMDLYNTRRAQAASAGDGAAINQWMSKIDALLATSKRIMRENY
ncbi:hypothetical protein I8D64_09010 [Brachybacterium sp. MASK1Z-5]|uniref:Tetratricopeptide repeat protein n=1 Tax=Brachybacterium halotolerans TaxID=2795215 RepID=A0ABS1BA78_9MICO|nr:hypothetical protein [Brachybacterium halotolerans]MBK0331541.1 hypothetical protein [Brachybacterium halotolerans]